MANYKKLSVYAKENNLTYKQAWNLYKAKALPVKTKETDNGRILVLQEAKASQDPKNVSFGTPQMVAFSEKGQKIVVSTASNEDGPSRRNKAATSKPTNEYYNIASGLEPFVLNAGYKQRTGFWDANLAINLCQKCYWNFAIFRNTIDAMTDFSTSNLFLRGGNAKSRDFFYKLFEAINIKELQDKFFREYYRSGNVFLYRFESVPVQDDITYLSKTYGFKIEAGKTVKLPSRYVILNPCDIGVQANIAFANVAMFFKRLNGYEIHRLRNAEEGGSDEEKNFLHSLPQLTQDQIKSGAGTVIIPLDPDIMYAVFYKKQDYEPLAIPMGWPVLKDIEWKAEMKNIDMAVSRTMQNVILLIKMGYESKEGEYMFDQKAAESMRSLFENESVGKTLVSDFTTEASFVIPAIGDFLDPQKYEVVNEDIKMGLNYVLTGTDQKFSNQYIQVQLFIERLKGAREAFINMFLLPEIKRLSKDLGFKAYPMPYFEDIDLKDSTNFDRIITRLAEIGLLTPAETFDALETGRIPTGEESIETQQEFRSQKDKGFYEPIMGGGYTQLKLAKIKATMPPAGGLSGPNGRPPGTKTPQSTKKVSPMKAEELYSLSKIKDNMILAMEVNAIVERELLKKHKIKELNNDQKQVAGEICDMILANEPVEKWKEKEIIKRYTENPINTNEERLKEIDEISLRHGISPFLGTILLASKLEANKDE